jgi:hypothetical protein
LAVTVARLAHACSSRAGSIEGGSIFEVTTYVKTRRT